MSASEESDSSAEFEVDKILDKKGKGSSLKYLVKWKGYDETSWEPLANCDCQELIIAFERDHAKSSTSDRGSSSRKRTRTAARESSNESSKVSVTSESSAPRKRSRRFQKSPKRRLPAAKSPTPAIATSDESEYFMDSSLVASSSRTSPRKPVKKPSVAPGTPKKTGTPGRTRASLRTPAAISPKRKRSKVNSSASSSSHSPQLQASPAKRSRTTGNKSASKSPKKKSPTKAPRALTPLAEIAELDYEIDRIESLADSNGRKKLLVKTTEGRSKTVDIKAAAKQNTDLVLDFLIARLD